MKYCFIIGFILFFIGFLFLEKAETFAGFCFLTSFILIPIAIILFIIQLVKNTKKEATKNQNAPVELSNLRPFLCSISNYRKSDGKLVRGDCAFAFDDNLFIISQGDEKITNEIDSIYYFDIWEHKDETHFKICMRSHTEYIFKSIHFEADKIAEYLKGKGIKIEDNRE